MALARTNNNYVFVPESLNDAMKYADMVSKSNFCPPSLKGKSGDVLIAMQMGAEVGLSPMQALQNIAVINGRPSIWGDAALAVVIASPSYVSHREWEEGSIKDGTLTSFCAITRRGSEEYIKSFSMEDAKRAGLWEKAGVWKQYPSRMLQMRARAFAIRDKFADALRGINIREEVEDYQVLPKKASVIQLKEPVKKTEIIDAFLSEIKEQPVDIDEMLLDISQVVTQDELEKIYKSHYKICISKKDNVALERLMEAKDNKKDELAKAAADTAEEFFGE